MEELFKVPDYAIIENQRKEIKKLNVELGKMQSLIDEVEYLNKVIKKERNETHGRIGNKKSKDSIIKGLQRMLKIEREKNKHIAVKG